ncbi:MAG: insulinase family protein, partial [Anaerolineae bacterium]
HPLATNGILYFDLGFDLSSLPADLVPYLGFFGRLLLQMGTQTQDYVRLNQRIGQKTGGIGSTLMLNTVFNENRPATWFFLRGKALLSQANDLLAILRDVLLTARFDDGERFKQILLEEKAGMESGLIPSGHMVVNRRLRARFTVADRFSEQSGGVSYLFFLRDLLQRVDQDWQGVLQTLENLRHQVIRRSALILNLTLDPAAIPSLLTPLTDFVAAIPDHPAEGVSLSLTPPAIGSEALLVPSQVNFVGKGANLYELGYRYHGSIHVINNYLGTTYLWEKVRVQGGAYGGFAGFDPNSGVWTYLSYRDPNLIQTLKNYDDTPDFLRRLELPEEERVKAIIGTIGDLDTYQLPDAKGWSALVRYLSGISDEHRQRVRDEVLSTSEKHFKDLAEVLAELARQGQVVVLGAEETVHKANQELGNLLTPLKVL